MFLLPISMNPFNFIFLQKSQIFLFKISATNTADSGFFFTKGLKQGSRLYNRDL